MEKQIKKKRWIWISVILLFIVAAVIIANLDVKYTAKIIYDEQESYIEYAVQTYTEVVSQTDCDYSTGCHCIQQGFWSGLVGDYCVRCTCDRTRTVPVEKWRTVQKERLETRECILIKKIFKQCENQVK